MLLVWPDGSRLPTHDLLGRSAVFPVLACRFDEVIQGPAMAVISDYLAELARRGILSVQVAETDARYFMDMLDGGVLLKQIRANGEPLAREEIEQIVERTVDAFLRSLRH
ncbi:TPA: TetR/AcrR family transcriptional regulator C-terminal domain-containing protein [Pseudomonas aeruginosa]